MTGKAGPAAISPAEIRANLGLLVILPIVILLWGSEWSVGVPIDHRWLLLLVWAGLLGLRWDVGRSGSASTTPGWIYRNLQRADPVLAGLLIYAVLFRLPQSPRSLLLSLLISLTLIASIALLRRASGPLLLNLGIVFVILGVVAPRVIQSRLIARVAATYELSIDHRMVPDGKQINSDGVRFHGEAIYLADDDFVILFLGDSFTYGVGLPYAQTYPSQFEAIAREGSCRSVVRAVNFGWISSSPLLGLRLLREVGYKYRPDLVVYNLDMTDFQDDLRYENWLREQKDYAFDASAVMERLVMMELPWAAAAMPPIKSVTDLLRGADAENPESLLNDLSVPSTEEHFFITQYPLEKSQPAIELGVMKNLSKMHEVTRDLLSAEMALVIFPRAYQYSKRESPQNWEAIAYREHRFLKEPFRYFERVADSLPYPVLDLLPDFEGSEEFPLFFQADPHWNQTGARVAARSTYRRLAQQGLIPCAVD